VIVAVAIASLARVAVAQEGRLFLQVRDLDGSLVRGVRFTSGRGTQTGEPTDQNGRTWVTLPAAMRPGEWVTLEFAEDTHPPWLFISPPDRRLALPTFTPGSRELFAQVVVARRGAAALLVDGRAVKAITLAVLKRLSPGSHGALTRQIRDAALSEEARRFGLAPGELEPAIRAWAQRSRDPGARAIAAYYEGDFAQAERLASESVTTKEADLVVGYLVWAESLLWQAKYGESTNVFRKALAVGGEDTRVLNELALSLGYEERYAEAESLFRRAAEFADATGMSDDLAMALNGVGNVAFRQGRYAEAIEAYSRAFDVKDSPYLDVTLGGSGRVFMALGRNADAEVAFARALEIRERGYGPDQFEAAVSLGDLGGLYLRQGKHSEAERLLTRAVGIIRNERRVGPAHPFAAVALQNLAEVYVEQGRRVEAEALFRESLSILEKTVGPTHSSIADVLERYAPLLRTLNRDAEATAAERRASAIRKP
jgi:tetratricopeptide (TPR) repeat protein